MSKKIGKSEKSKKGGHWPDRGGHAGAVARRDARAAEDEGETSTDVSLSREDYESRLYALQVELVKLQRHFIECGDRILILLEGRDAAGKDGSIKRIVEHLSPRETRVVALGKPSDRERVGWYFQRYVPHLPVAEELVLFNRSWYNRAGVEHVMGFCSKDQHKRFLEICPEFEKQITDNGITLIKYWLEVSNKEQKERFEARVEDPMRQWKLSNMDLPSRERWYDYSRARDKMLEATDTANAPWYLLRSDDKRKARLNLISHFLSVIPYEASPAKKVKLPARDKSKAYDDEASIKDRRWIAEKF